MTPLATPDAPLVWEAVSAALTGRPQTATTEAARADLADLDLRSTRELVRLLNDEDATVAGAVAEAATRSRPRSTRSSSGMRRGGRLDLRRRRHVGRARGARRGRVRPDLRLASRRGRRRRRRARTRTRTIALRRRTHCAGSPSGPTDCVVAVSASGSTPFTLAALEAAGDAGALGVAVVCVARQRSAAALAEHEVAVVVGPEVVAGSTRLKAGTAQKLVLNTISTVTMIRLGRTYGGLMVGVAPGQRRSCASARAATSCSRAARRRNGSTRRSRRGRRRARRARLAARRRRRRRGARARLDGSAGGSGPRAGARRRDEARRRGGARARRARPGRRRGRGRRRRRGRSRRRSARPHRGPGLRRPAGERLRRRRLPLRVERGLPPRRRGASAQRASPRTSRRSSPSAEEATVEALRAMPAGASGPRILGAHLEGPFLSPERPARIRSCTCAIPTSRCSTGCSTPGRVTEMTLAPELPGADALDRARLRERGVVVSAGHTNATAEEAAPRVRPRRRGRRRTSSTRCGRSAPAIPGIAGAALTRPDVVVQMIVDGHHLADETVQLVWACAAGRVALVTDAMAAAGPATAAAPSSSATSRSRSRTAPRRCARTGRSRARC